VLGAAFEESVKTNLTRRYGPGLTFTFKQNPALLGGLRVQVGSDVYDGSIRARLAQLEQSF
jgi:F-type H+-transporting ATPase subunit delta